MSPEAERRITAKNWRAIPGWSNYYAINPAGDVLSLERTVIRSDGTPYPVKPRIMRVCVHRPKGMHSRSVLLSRPGLRQRIYPHLIVREVFGDDVNAAA